jgi:hypothetical protein
MLDTKGLAIHSVRLAQIVGSGTYYESTDSPQMDQHGSTIVRDGDIGLWIKDSRGLVFWTPLVNVVEIKWGARKQAEKIPMDAKK